MTPLFRKLNLKDQAEILVLDAPSSFERELAALSGVTVRRDPSAVDAVRFALIFVSKEPDLHRAAHSVLEKAEGDSLIWFAYPKKSSKRYSSEIDRDHGWEIVGDAGFEPVRQVAIDEDWSALRFRRTAHIKSMTRRESMRLSPEGRARAKRN